MKTLIDKKDLDILSCLRTNSREKLKKIAKKVKLPISTIYDRIKKMEKNRVIKRYSCLIDPKKLNHHIKTQILFRVPSEIKKDFESKGYYNKYINSFFKITGGNWDYIAEGFFQNIDELYNYTENISRDYPGCKQEIHYIVNEIKHEEFLRG